MPLEDDSINSPRFLSCTMNELSIMIPDRNSSPFGIYRRVGGSRKASIEQVAGSATAASLFTFEQEEPMKMNNNEDVSPTDGCLRKCSHICT